MNKRKSGDRGRERAPRLLWANPFCLLDTSSGASMSVRQMLHQLAEVGYEIRILGATIFDDRRGMSVLADQTRSVETPLHHMVRVDDGPLTHELLVTQYRKRPHLTGHEESLWHTQYRNMLDSFRPDLVWFYGGQPLELLIPDEARARNIPSSGYLVNQHYMSSRWCRDVDVIVTDTEATSDLYKKRMGFAPKPAGKFINSENFVAPAHRRERLLFVNPSWTKGASIFVQLALKLEAERPDIPVEVVESRADWSSVLSRVTGWLGHERHRLDNVSVTPNTDDMKAPYSRARVLVAPSLWWESGARVLAEAMLNGIPAVVSDSGGNREMVGDGGIVVDLPARCFEKPYQILLDEEELQPLFDAIVAMYDDEALYNGYVENARSVGREKHHIDISTQRLRRLFDPLVNRRAGDTDFLKSQRRRHRHNIAGYATEPEFKPMPIPVSQTPLDASVPTTGNDGGVVETSFDWEISGKVTVLDTRSRLILNSELEPLLETGAFAVISFDPASEVQDIKAYQDRDDIQVFQHALLGDGQTSILYVCLSPDMTSTLKPLPSGQLSSNREKDAQILTELPINTVALDSIEGLNGMDWLVIDEKSNVLSVLRNGVQHLEKAVLVTVRVAFKRTHENQVGFGKIQSFLESFGFEFERFSRPSYISSLPSTSGLQKNFSSTLEQADAIFLPSCNRLDSLTSAQRNKLILLLHNALGAYDRAFELIAERDSEKAELYHEYLRCCV